MPEERARSDRGRLEGAPRAYGRSREGVPLGIWAPPDDPADVLVVAGVHGDEPESVVVTSAALRSGPRARLRTPVVLAANPDGLLRGTRGNAAGVDLNRNWPATTWSPEPVPYRWSLESPRDVELGPGGAPGSEPETAALLDLIRHLRPRVVLSVHAPLGWVDDPAATPLGRWLARASGLPLVGDPGYATPGSLGTWGAEQGIPVVTYELPRAPIEHLVRDHAPLLLAVMQGEADGVGPARGAAGAT